MEISSFEHKEIQITSVYFRSNPEQHRLESYPKRMLLEGREYNFVESSMRYLIQKGQDLIRLFDVNDGQTSYRLRNEGSNWTLIHMKAGI